MRMRGYTAVELVVVITVITIGGTVAVTAMSNQVEVSRARSDELGLVMRVKTERNAARERMRPLGLDKGPDGSVRFHDVEITGVGDERTCHLQGVKKSVRFANATIGDVLSPGPSLAAALQTSGAGPLCIDEDGRPIGEFNLRIEASDGKRTDLSITKLGLLKSKLLYGVEVDDDHGNHDNHGDGNHDDDGNNGDGNNGNHGDGNHGSGNNGNHGGR